MIKNYPQISSTYGLTGTNLQTKSTGSTSADIVSSFKEIFSTMMMANSTSSSDAQATPGVSDLIAPLMLMLFEKMIEQQLEQSTSTTDSSQVSSDTNNIFSNVSQKLTAQPQGRPVAGVLTQDYHPGHNGLDFGIAVGTPIKTTMDGQVVYAGWSNEGYGNLVIVENGAYRTYYAHLSSIPVTVGNKVSAGTTIGLSGNTGNSTGPHLHYEIRKNKVPINPTSVTLGASG